MGSVEARVLHTEELADNFERAFLEGSDHELALALTDFLRFGIMMHSAAAGDSVSQPTAQACAANLGFALAQMIREGRNIK